MLLANHRDFDLGDEMVMADYATLAGGLLQIGQMRYKTVVLPYCAALQPETTELLRSFLSTGGEVYLVGDNTLASSLTGVELVANPQALVSVLETKLARLVSITGDDREQAAQVLYQQRADGDRQLFFLANTKLNEAASLRVEVAAQGDVTVFEPTTGEVVTLSKGDSSPFAWAAVEVLETDQNRVVLQWHAPPAGSLMFSIGLGADTAIVTDDVSNTTQAAAPSGAAEKWYTGFPDNLADEKSQALLGPWQFSRLHPNVLTLDYCRASVDGGSLSVEYRPIPAVREEVLKLCGRTPQIQPYQYITGQVPSQSVPVQLEFTFHVETVPPDLALAVEQPEKLQVSVNGYLVTKRAVNAAGTDLAYAC
jgi:hypothetical protein